MDFAQPTAPRINRYQDPHMIVDLESQIVQLDGLLVQLTQKGYKRAYTLEEVGPD